MRSGGREGGTGHGAVIRGRGALKHALALQQAGVPAQPPAQDDGRWPHLALNLRAEPLAPARVAQAQPRVSRRVVSKSH